MLKVAIIQSNYIPWKGYFDIIHDVDLFIFADDLQYTKEDWRNRNKIKTLQGVVWITIPTGPCRDRLICEVEINDHSWQEQHWTKIYHAYHKAPYFKQYGDYFERIYLDSIWSNLSVFNQYLIMKISQDILGINTIFKDSRDYHGEGRKLSYVLDLLHKVGATYYLSGPTAKCYCIEECFRESGIELVYKDYSGYPEYPQLFPPFEHAVSILDVIFNCGPATPDYIWGWREKQYSFVNVTNLDTKDD